MAMGNYFFTTPEGDEVKVEYSFGYVLDDGGNVRINLHHSSMPFGIMRLRQIAEDKTTRRSQMASSFFILVHCG